MSDDFDPETFGFTEKDKARTRIIVEVDEMKRLAIKNGAGRHLSAMDNIEKMALDSVEKNYKED